MNKDLDFAGLNLTSTATFIVTFGFLGVGLVMFVVLSAISWNRSRAIAYVSMAGGLAFIVAFGVLNLLKENFPRLITGERTLLSGAVLGVPNLYKIQVRSDQWRAGEAYIKRENEPADNALSRQLFILASHQTPTCLVVAVVNVDPRSDKAFFFTIEHLSAADMLSNVDIVGRVVVEAGNPLKLQIWRERDEATSDPVTVLNDQGDGGASCAASHKQDSAQLWRNLFGIHAAAAAAASTEPNGAEISSALQSDDVFLRRQTRYALALYGEKALPIFNRLLDSKSYRLNIGALVALTYVPFSERAEMRKVLQIKISAFLSSTDPELKRAAALALSDKPSTCGTFTINNVPADAVDTVKKGFSASEPFPKITTLPESGGAFTVVADFPICDDLDNLTFEENTDRPGGDYKTVSVSDASSCQRLCQADTQCSAYTFIPPQFRLGFWTGPRSVCFLKKVPSNAADGAGVPLGSPGMTSGVRVK